MGTVPPHVAEISRGFGETAGKPLSRSKAKGFAKIFVEAGPGQTTDFGISLIVSSWRCGFFSKLFFLALPAPIVTVAVETPAPLRGGSWSFRLIGGLAGRGRTPPESTAESKAMKSVTSLCFLLRGECRYWEAWGRGAKSTKRCDVAL